ncbi:MAG: tyrosine-type recombinase/integrase [Xanthobacteraceae bacterium]
MATGTITVSRLNGLAGWLWDDRVIGLGARKQTRAIFYYLRYRHHGRQIVKSIGRHGSPWTPELARKKALELLGTLAGGDDPFAQPLASEGFGAEVDRYLERKRAVLKPRSYVEEERYLRKSAAPLHRLKLAEVDRRNIALVLAEIERNSGAASRNRARASLSSFFSWCVTEGLTDNNPVTGTAKADEGHSRERVLTTIELRKLWHGLGDDRFSDIVRLLLLTAARRNEIGHLRWSEVDLVRKLIALPPERTKNGRRFELPLSRRALAIIERIPRRNSSDFLFSDKLGFKDWGGAKTALNLRIGIAEWRLHDLRRSAATYMAELGIQPHIIEAVLNHQSGHKGGVAGIYNRAKYLPEMWEALQRWADYLHKITG